MDLSFYQEEGSLGCLLESTWNGQKPNNLNGSIRKFLEDGDEVIFKACCKVGPHELLIFLFRLFTVNYLHYYGYANQIE